MLINTEELSFSYPDSHSAALDGVSISVPEGSFTVLCGMSGCGKSTLLRLLKPGLAPNGKKSGSVKFRGEELGSLPPVVTAQKIGFVAQDPESQIVTDKVWHEIAFSAESVGIPPDEMRRRAAECSEYFGLERLFDSDTATLSGGEKQLVALASAAVLHPELLLLDEPTSQLDPIAAQSLIDAVIRLNRDFGVTVVIAEHRLEELLPAADRVIVMDNGRIAADCAPRDITAFLPSDHPMLAAMPAAVRIFTRAGGEGSCPLSVREGRSNAACRIFLAENDPEERTRKAPVGEPVMTARELWVSYGKNSPDALKTASLSLYGGEVYALLGGNGSGKSTLLKVLAGVVKPLSGKVKTARGAKLAYLPQNPCVIFGADSALEELTSRGLDKETAAAELERFGLTAVSGTNPLDLSGGEQQRLALAALLSGKPDILLLDEPTKGMDALSKERLCSLFGDIAASGAAVLVVTHDVSFAAQCADRCGLLFNGEIVSENEPKAFFGENYFYTTPLCRMARGINDKWI
ncbi:MAG: ABC transporter ATP-binding protein [Oscillospiraceae bacterium]